MGSNERHPGEVRVTMPEIEHSDFIRDESAKLISALGEAQKQESDSSQRAKPLIQRVPPVLIRIKEDFGKYFKPRLVALGPLHHGLPQFERAEHTKRKLAALFAKENQTTGEVLFSKIMAEIKDLKRCYNPEDIQDYDDEKLAWMFFVDGCAVLFAVHYGLQGDFKRLDTKADLLVFAQLDLFLLENQLPYRVLKILIDSSKDPTKWEQSITEFIGDNLITNIRDGKKSPHTEEEAKQEYTHLLERLRTKHLTGMIEASRSSMIGRLLLSCGHNREHRKTFRSVKELKESGISVRPSESDNLKNISFYCNFLGSLKMPRILVDDSTASKFLNLVALEMCRDFENDFAVTSYLYFLDSLIDTAADVKEMRVTGMLHNYLGSDEEVADLFNKLSRDLVPDQAMYKDATDNIHRYCNNPWTTPMAQAYYTHFSSPWTFLGFLAALLGLLFSAIQAYYSFPNNKKTK
ncbi:UPF0481 protein At3g47200-like [Herrania umbratica]|uniref:UPF0481 protein At3g47200-like n=1 Tax=Herrania umbratica TaxID=108875 RepID=A0A6J1A761_9ROSI|nr:UPF0481 protein At3g47200-like [Herrania umbratica]